MQYIAHKIHIRQCWSFFLRTLLGDRRTNGFVSGTVPRNNVDSFFTLVGISLCLHGGKILLAFFYDGQQGVVEGTVSSEF